MPTIRIIDTDIEIAFSGEVDEAALVADAQKMADLINSKPWTDPQRDAFQIMRRIVFFAGQVTVNGYVMDRPCCDENHATFYWEAEEFNRNTDADVHANTLFHDCWHVVQFRRSGNLYARSEQERIDRELDAIAEQIEVARTLGCSAAEIGFLETFRADQDRIRTRLAEGVNSGPMLHEPRTAKA